MKKILWSIIILAGIGAIDSAYALWQHFAPLGSSLCNISPTISCDIVNKSPWSEFFSIPVALIGLVGYLVLVGLALFIRAHSARVPLLTRGLAATAMVGLIVATILSYIEFFIIGAICPLCVISQGVMTIIAVLALMLVFCKQYDDI